MIVNITEREKKLLEKQGVINLGQNLEMTAERHLRKIREAKLSNPEISIKILRLLKVNENIIQEAIQDGQEKIETDLMNFKKKLGGEIIMKESIKVMCTEFSEGKCKGEGCIHGGEHECIPQCQEICTPHHPHAICMRIM